MTSQQSPRVEFRGRMVADHYPERHAAAQRVTSYDDFTDGVTRDRIKYGDPKDMNPGGITYATREERIAYRIKSRRDALASLLMKYASAGAEDDPAYLKEVAWIDSVWPHKDDPNDLIDPDEVIRTDHRCPDCDVDVGEFHLPGCDVERCARCEGQSIGCSCARSDEGEE